MKIGKIVVAVTIGAIVSHVFEKPLKAFANKLFGDKFDEKHAEAHNRQQAERRAAYDRRMGDEE